MITRNIKQPHIYAIIPVYNEELLIDSFLRELANELNQITINYKIIVIDDGSSDMSKQIIQKLIYKLNCIKLISFSRNFGQEAAIRAGLAASTDADAAIIMDCDFQHPIKIINHFYVKWLEGYSNIYGVRTRKDQNIIRSFLSNTFFKFSNKVMRLKIPVNAGHFRLLDKQCIKAFNSLAENNLFIRGLFNWIGFKSCAVPFNTAYRKDGTSSRWGYNKLFKLAVTGIFSFSLVPIRLISIFGFIILLFILIYSFYIFSQKLIFNINISINSIIIISIMFFSSIQLIAIGILGEYISLILNETKKRPKYIIDENESRNI